MFDALDDFMENPIKKTLEVATQPIDDARSILEGLSEGEIREAAIARFGADAVVGLGASELIDLLLS